MTDPLSPSETDVELAKESSRKLAPLTALPSSTIELQFSTNPKKLEKVTLPKGAVQFLVHMLTEMAQGNAVTLMPIHAQLTTQQAARIVGVSRPFIIKEMQAGRIRYQTVGTHRRILFKDLMAYKQECINRHNKAMNELVQEAQELGFGY
jgi:excisionase family DNA binding protein